MAEDAKVTVGADATAVIQAAGAVKDAWKNAGGEIAGAFASASRQMVASIGDVVLAQGRINFQSQHQQVRDLESATARLAVAMGRDFESVKASINATATSIGEQPKDVAAWVQSVGQLTYSFQGAMDALGGIRQLSAATGRSIGDYRGLAVELVNIGKVGGDASRAIGVIAKQAELLKVQGGVAAFADQIEALGGTLAKVSIKSEADFLKITALAGALAQGLSPQQAKQAQQEAIGAIVEDPRRWERFLGHKLRDKEGRIAGDDFVKILTDIVDRDRSHRGLKQSAFVLAQQQNLGLLGGAAASNVDREALQAAMAAGPSTKPADALAAYQKTAPGKREAAEVELSKSSQELLGSSTKLGAAADALQQFAAKNPLTGTFLTTLTGGITGAVGAAISSAVATSKGGGAARLLAGAGAGLGSAAAVAPALLGIGAYAATKYGADKFERESEQVIQEEEEIGVAGHAAKLLTAKKKRQKRIAELEAGGMEHGLAVYQAGEEEKARAAGGAIDYAKMGQALADALQRGAKFQVTTRSDTPVEVTAQSQQSSAAGGQSGG